LETVAKNKLYEGMFLVDSSLAGADWDGIIAAIRKILEKAEAEIVSIEKWDERKLAYDIKGKGRGTYILSYFRVEGGKIKDIEKSVRLSEKILRVLILSAEKLSQEDMEKETPAMRREKRKEEEGEETTSATEDESASYPDGFEDAEDSEDIDETDETEDSDSDKISDAGMVLEEVAEQQPEDEVIEDFEQADEK
jgi:small subunit ribosomal protein S6